MAAFEGFTQKICPESVSQHGNIQFVDNFYQLSYLRLSQKLRFINKYAVQRLGTVSLKYLPEQVIFVTV